MGIFDGVGEIINQTITNTVNDLEKMRMEQEINMAQCAASERMCQQTMQMQQLNRGLVTSW